MIAPVSIDSVASLFPYPDRFLYMSLKSILLTVFNTCVLPANNMISVLNMVGDCGFILLPCDGCLPLGTRECFFRSFLSLSFMFFQSCSKEARGLTNIGFVTVTARDFIDTVTNLANIPLVLRMYKTVA